MRSKNKVLAIICADIHLSHKSPIARSAEPNWYQAMKRPLSQLGDIQGRYKCPILCAGDVFDKWNSPPELINFAIAHLPRMNSIPGNHDLPYHLLEVEKSAYWTVALSGAIANLHYLCKHSFADGDLTVYPSWDGKFGLYLDQPRKREKTIRLALIHAYCWFGSKKHLHAKPDGNVQRWWKNRLVGYTAAAFGDNHLGWHAIHPKHETLNCGTLMRRKADEIAYKPSVGLLYSNGTFRQIFLDCSEDKFVEPDILKELERVDLTDLLADLRATDGSLDFKETVTRALKDCSRACQKVVLSALDSA